MVLAGVQLQSSAFIARVSSSTRPTLLIEGLCEERMATNSEDLPERGAVRKNTEKSVETPSQPGEQQHLPRAAVKLRGSAVILRLQRLQTLCLE